MNRSGYVLKEETT